MYYGAIRQYTSKKRKEKQKNKWRLTYKNKERSIKVVTAALPGRRGKSMEGPNKWAHTVPCTGSTAVNLEHHLDTIGREPM